MQNAIKQYLRNRKKNMDKEAFDYLSLLTILADNSLLEIEFSGLDGPPLDIALKLPVMLDWPLQQPTRIQRSSKPKAQFENRKPKFKKCTLEKNIKSKPTEEILCGMNKRIYIPSPMPG